MADSTPNPANPAPTNANPASEATPDPANANPASSAPDNPAPVDPQRYRRQWRRRLHQLVAALCTAGLLGSFAMIGGTAANDHRIESDPGRALATVTGTSLLRTTVEFRDDAGLYQAPSTGVLYPTGLAEGQQVWVQYSRENPDLVKVAGRGWTLAIIPGLSVAVLVVVVTLVLWRLISFATRPKKREQNPKETKQR